MAANANMEDPDIAKEQQKFFNFLQHYDLHKYHQAFLNRGVSRISHLKAVDEKDLRDIGLSRPESNRLKKKLEKNFSVAGKLVKSITGKARKFEVATGEMVYVKRDGEPDTYHTASLIAREEVKLGKKIGEGAHGAVYEGTWSNVHGSVAVAIKTLYGREEVQAQFIKEADSMRSMNHSHIIRLYGVVLSSPLMLVEELAPFGNLQHHLQNKGKTLNLNVFHTYASQIADAMKYLEEHRIVHRDLATRNILLSSEDFIKLSDFGMARVLDDHSEVYNLSNLGARIPIAWTALEALTHAKFSTASDVWSYAVTLWEIYSLGRTPWEGLSPIAIRDNLSQGERLGRPERCPPEVYKLMLSCWERLAQDRPTFADIHERIQTLSPRLVGGLKDHNVAEDPNSLSFKKGELIFIIERPKPEYLFGMKVSGEIGHFLADHVTTQIDTVDHLREKVQSGKARASKFPISGPTDVSHDYHWGRDGKKWFANEAQNHDIAGKVRQGAHTETPSRDSSISPSTKPLDTRSPSPGACRARSDKVDIQILEDPRQHYVSSQQQPLGSDLLQGMQHLDIGNSEFTTSEQALEHDQYVFISSNEGRTSMLEPVPPPEEQSAGYNYLRMQPDLTRLHQYQNLPTQDQPLNPTAMLGLYRDDVPAYAISSPVDRVQSSDSGSDVFSPVPPTILEDMEHVDPSSLQNPLIPVSPNMSPSTLQEPWPPSSRYSVPSFSTKYPQPASMSASSYRYQEEAITPSNVKYMRCATTAQDPFSGRTVPVPLPTMPDTRQRPYSVSGDTRRVGYTSQKSTSVDAIPESGELFENHQNYQDPFETNVKRSLSVGSPGRVRKRASPRQSWAHGYEKIPSSSDRAGTLPREDLEPLLSVGSSNEGNTSPVFRPIAVMELHSVGALESILREEFPDALPEMCREALEANRHDINSARKYLQVQVLLGMGIPYVNAEDCKRALSHCQWKMDRAATWLLEQSFEIGDRKT